MKAILFTLAIMIWALLTACTAGKTMLTTAQIVSLSDQLEDSYEVVLNIVTDPGNAWTTEELEALEKADMQLRAVHKRVSGFTADTPVTKDETLALYDTAKEAYLSARSVVVKRFDQMSPEEQLTLKSVETKAKALDAQIEELRLSLDSDPTAQQILSIVEMAVTIGKTVLPLLVL